MHRCGGPIGLFRGHELPAAQYLNRGLHRTFGEARGFRNVPKAPRHWTPTAARCKSI